MAVIAIAGGSGRGLGRAITTACSKEHKVIVLSRESSKTPEWLEQLKDVEVRRVDYGSEESLKGALDGVNIIISTLLALDGTWASAQIRLFQCGISVGATRFVPSDWGFGPLNAERVSMFSSMLEVWEACRAAAKAHRGTFEWGAFHPGGFMNYLGLGNPHPEATNGFGDDYPMIWDVANMRASVPLKTDGSTGRITLTELGDLGGAVSAACNLPFGTWEEHMGVAGDTKNIDEVTAIIEKVRGRKMEVEYKTTQEVEKAVKAAEGDALQELFMQLHLAYTRDEVNESVIDPVVNRLVGDSVKLQTVEEYVTKFWTGV